MKLLLDFITTRINDMNFFQKTCAFIEQILFLKLKKHISLLEIGSVKAEEFAELGESLKVDDERVSLIDTLLAKQSLQTSLLMSFFKISRKSVFFAILAIIGFLISSYWSPVLTGLIIKERTEGRFNYLHFIGLSLSTGLMYIFLNQVFWFSFLFSINARSFCFRILLKITTDNTAFRAQALSIVSHELPKIQSALENIFLALLIVPSISICIYLMVGYLGWSSLLGLFLLTLMVLLTYQISHKIRIQSEDVALRNKQRLFWVDLILTHFEAICGQGLFHRVRNELQTARKEELQYLHKTNNSMFVLTAVFTAMPTILVLGSILPSVMINKNVHIDSIFATLILLGTLQSSFTHLPRMVFAIVQGFDSLKRFALFFAKTKEENFDSYEKKNKWQDLCNRMKGHSCIIEGTNASEDLKNIADYFSQEEPVAYIGSKPWIINGTLKENINNLFKRDDEHIKTVLNSVFLKFPDSETIKSIFLESDSANISGGQAQRIALARVLLSGARVFVLDDSFRSLDPSLRKNVFDVVSSQAHTFIFSSTDQYERQFAQYQLKNSELKPFKKGKFIERDSYAFATESTIDSETFALKPEEGDKIRKGDFLDKGTLKFYFSLFGKHSYWISLVFFFLVFEVSKFISEMLLAQLGNAELSTLLSYAILVPISIVTSAIAIYMTLNAALGSAQSLWNSIIEFFTVSSFSQTRKFSKSRHYSHLVYDQQVADQSAGNKTINFLMSISNLSSSILVSCFVFPILIPLYIVLSFFYFRYAMKFRRACKSIASLNSKTTGNLFSRFMELIDGSLVLKFSHYRDIWEDQYVKKTQECFESGILMNKYLERWLCLRLELIGVGVFIALAWLGAAGSTYLASSSIAFGLTLTYLSRLPASLGRVIRMLVDLDQDLVSVEHLSRYCKLQDIKKRPYFSVDWKELISPDIAITDVTFQYPSSKKAIIANLSTNIYRGDRVGILGRSGSGKSTFLRLILGMFQPNEGSIKIKGKDASALSREELEKIFYYIPQSSIAVPGNLRNLLPVCIEKQCWEALKIMGVDQKVRNLPGELNYIVSDDFNSVFSLADKQRFFLAGCLLTQAENIILDEATSAILSDEARSILVSILENLPKEKTLILISHQLQTVSLMNKQIQFEDEISVYQKSKSSRATASKLETSVFTSC